MTAQLATSRFHYTFALCVAMLVMACGTATAQNFQSVLGGVDIDPNGVLNGGTADLDPSLREQLIRGLSAADSDISKRSNLRIISLRGLEEAMNEAARSGKKFPAEIEFMAGLQRIEYVMLSPEGDDVLIGGFGEGWKVDAKGNVVGETTGMPVVQLQDFLVAMRYVNEARQGQGISVSIDPTAEGIQRLQQFYNANRRVTSDMKNAIESTVGNQMITLTGVPKDSRFSNVLVAADYKMKRLSMGLEQSPIKQLPSVIEMARRSNAKFNDSSPRFWMECNYEPVATNDDNTIFQIRGQGVKALTEDAFFDKDGNSVRRKGKTNKFAKKWADQMTRRYDELSKSEPVFRDLRNLMDLSVVAALISRENLLQRANLNVPAINSKESFVSVPSLNVPKSVPSQAGFVQFRNSMVVSVSGGVQVDSWSIAANLEKSLNSSQVRTTAANQTAQRWWWNAAN